MALLKNLLQNAAVSSHSCRVLSIGFTVRGYQQSHPMRDNDHDIVVIGGGIMGAAAARELIIRHPKLKIALVEKELNFGLHQSGHNSGVIHAGIYYKPGSMKAKLCVKGAQLMYKYCEEMNVPYKQCGQLIVATRKPEIPLLLRLYDRGIKNGVKDLRLLNSKEIEDCEPSCRGLEAIWSPHTGVVDYGQVTRTLAEDFVLRGGTPYLIFEAAKFEEERSEDYPVIISDKQCSSNCIRAKYVLACCGLQSDTVAVLTGCQKDPQIIPVRGEYLQVMSKWSDIIKTNIYPVPDPRLPFLGVHVTPTIHGKVILGPNALMAFQKEGYSWSDVNMDELKQMVTYPGFRHLAIKFSAFGMKEMVRSVVTSLQLRQVQRMVPDLSVKIVEKGFTGVRAQALHKDGSFVDDFLFDSQPESGTLGRRVLHCRNAPSPGATAALAFAKIVAAKMKDLFKL